MRRPLSNRFPTAFIDSASYVALTRGAGHDQEVIAADEALREMQTHDDPAAGEH